MVAGEAQAPDDVHSVTEELHLPWRAVRGALMVATVAALDPSNTGSDRPTG